MGHPCLSINPFTPCELCLEAHFHVYTLPFNACSVQATATVRVTICMTPTHHSSERIFMDQGLFTFHASKPFSQMSISARCCHWAILVRCVKLVRLNILQETEGLGSHIGEDVPVV